MIPVYVDIFSAMGEVLCGPGTEMVAVQVVRKGRWLVVRFSLEDRAIDTTFDLNLLGRAHSGVCRGMAAAEMGRALRELREERA